MKEYDPRDLRGADIRNADDIGTPLEGLTPGLVELAKRSPPGYAAMIRDRNRGLLERLEALELFLGATRECHALLEAISIATSETNHGCPHCGVMHPCMNCLWTGVFSPFERNADGSVTVAIRRMTCCRALFDGINHNDVQSYVIGVEYGCSSENLSCWPGSFLECPPEDRRRQYGFVKRFLEAHVRWADLPCWGEKYKG